MYFFAFPAFVFRCCRIVWCSLSAITHMLRVLFCYMITGNRATWFVEIESRDIMYTYIVGEGQHRRLIRIYMRYNAVWSELTLAKLTRDHIVTYLFHECAKRSFYCFHWFFSAINNWSGLVTLEWKEVSYFS